MATTRNTIKDSNGDSSSVVETPSEDTLEVHAPFIFDIGKRKKKVCKRIKEGRGPVQKNIEEALEYTADEMGDAAKGKVFVPVVVLYERRRKRRDRWW